MTFGWPCGYAADEMARQMWHVQESVTHEGRLEFGVAVDVPRPPSLGLRSAPQHTPKLWPSLLPERAVALSCPCPLGGQAESPQQLSAGYVGNSQCIMEELRVTGLTRRVRQYCHHVLCQASL